MYKIFTVSLPFPRRHALVFATAWPKSTLGFLGESVAFLSDGTEVFLETFELHPQPTNCVFLADESAMCVICLRKAITALEEVVKDRIRAADIKELDIQALGLQLLSANEVSLVRLKNSTAAPDLLDVLKNLQHLYFLKPLKKWS